MKLVVGVGTNAAALRSGAIGRECEHVVQVEHTGGHEEVSVSSGQGSTQPTAKTMLPLSCTSSSRRSGSKNERGRIENWILIAAVRLLQLNPVDKERIAQWLKSVCKRNRERRSSPEG